MNVSNVEVLDFRAPTAVTFEVDPIPTSPREWNDALGELALTTLFGPQGRVVSVSDHPHQSYTIERRPEAGKRRDFWAGDHLWHADGTRWNINPVFTGIVCEQADPGAPGTQLLDTARLLEIIDADDFWAQHGIDGNTADSLDSIFQDGTYYRSALPYIFEKARGEDQELMARYLCKEFSEVGLAERADREDQLHGKKAFPLIRETAIAGVSSLFIDGGGRNADITDRFTKTSHVDALNALRLNYLSGNLPRELDLVRTVEWAPGRALVFAQVGTLHRALPGNDFNRRLHQAFLVNASQKAAWLHQHGEAGLAET